MLESSGIKLGCVFQNRENPEYIKLKNYLDSGALGKVLLCQSTINWYRSPKYYEDSWRGTIAMDGGAALINQGIHTVDLIIDLMGEVSEVNGYIDTLYHKIEGEDIGIASIKFKSGALGTLSFETSYIQVSQNQYQYMEQKGIYVLLEVKLFHQQLIT